MTPSPKAIRLGTAAALCAATSAQAQESCPLENRVYELTPMDQRMNLAEAGELREGVYLRLDPVLRELQSCASREDIQSSTQSITFQDGDDLLVRNGVFGTPLEFGTEKHCCFVFRQCDIAVQVYRGSFICRR